MRTGREWTHFNVSALAAHSFYYFMLTFEIQVEHNLPIPEDVLRVFENFHNPNFPSLTAVFLFFVRSTRILFFHPVLFSYYFVGCSFPLTTFLRFHHYLRLPRIFLVVLFNSEYLSVRPTMINCDELGSHQREYV